MRQRTLQLFQLLLVIFAFYILLKHTGNERFLVSVACLIVAFLVGKVETDVREGNQTKKGDGKGLSKKDQERTTSESLDWLLKSKHVVVLTDAVQHLLRDLGLEVSPSMDHPGIDRLIRIPGMEVTWGLKVLGDVEHLNKNLKRWEELANFDLDKGGRQRLLIVASNCAGEGKDRRQAYKEFSADAKKLVSDRHLVAITTRTLAKIYLSCKEQKVDINTIFHSLRYHPGGVF